MLDWKHTTYDIINNKRPEHNYEMVRKHIDLGVQLDINDKEMEMLKNMLEMSAHWKSLARKILKSRVLSKLEQQVIVHPASMNTGTTFEIILKKNQD